MADAAALSNIPALSRERTKPRHAAMVRAAHWLTTLFFLLLLWTGIEILISHPRLYWGEYGNVNTAPLLIIPIPASRESVPTGYSYVLPDQNGWSRSLHFEAAWFLVFTGAAYFLWGLYRGHIQRNLLPARSELSWLALRKSIVEHLHWRNPNEADAGSYNALQRMSYLGVIFVLSPLMIWTGLAMSPAIAGAFPGAVWLLGGQQSARTIHFFGTVALVLFVLVHVAMVCRAGFWSRTRAMITGKTPTKQEVP